MSDQDLLCLVLFAWAGVATGFLIEAKRENRMSKQLILHLVNDKGERERFFTGFEKMIEGRDRD